MNYSLAFIVMTTFAIQYCNTSESDDKVSEFSDCTDFGSCNSYHSDFGDARLSVECTLEKTRNESNITEFTRIHYIVVSGLTSFPKAVLLRHQVYQHWLKWIVQNDWIRQLDDDRHSLDFLAKFCCAGFFSAGRKRRYTRIQHYKEDMLQSLAANSSLLSDLHCICMQSNQAFVVKAIQYFLHYLFRASDFGFNSDQIYAIYLRMYGILQDREKILADEKWIHLCFWLSCFDQTKSENGLCVAIPASIKQLLINVVSFGVNRSRIHLLIERDEKRNLTTSMRLHFHKWNKRIIRRFFQKIENTSFVDEINYSYLRDVHQNESNLK